ncbi:MAG: hypothetical protein JNK14_02320 [Chitinophagaceae bacterium]|nr:hypothetical protein [Chitinophagaceae bacterium]
MPYPLSAATTALRHDGGCDWERKEVVTGGDEETMTRIDFAIDNNLPN